MWKLVLAGAVALLLAGSPAVNAQPWSGGPDRPRWQPSQEDIAAFVAARIAALKAGLVLTPEQEKNWPAFEAALRDLARHRAERMAARRAEQPAGNPTERLRRYAEALNGYGTVLKKLADAQEPLYNSLDDAQKRRFAILARPMRRGGYERRGDDDRGGEHRRWRHRHDRGERRGDTTSGEGERL